MAFSSRDVAVAYHRIRGNGICRTPVLQSKCIDALAGKSLFFKSEHLQTTGSFKTRGAFNAVSGRNKYLDVLNILHLQICIINN